MRAVISRSSDVADGIAKWVCITLLALLVITVFASVLSRYLGWFVGAFDWIDESSRFLFVWVSLLGASRAVRSGQHIRIDVLLRVLPPAPRAVLEKAALAAAMVFLLIVLAEGLRLAVASAEHHSVAMGIPMTWVFSVVPLSAFIMLLHAIRHMVGVEDGRTVGLSEGVF